METKIKHTKKLIYRISLNITVTHQGPDYQNYLQPCISLFTNCNSSHNVVNHAIGIMEAFSNVNIVAKLLAKLQEVESSCRCTYHGVGGVIMWMKTRLESTKIVSSTIRSE